MMQSFIFANSAFPQSVFDDISKILLDLMNFMIRFSVSATDYSTPNDANVTRFAMGKKKIDQEEEEKRG